MKKQARNTKISKRTNSKKARKASRRAPKPRAKSKTLRPQEMRNIPLDLLTDNPVYPTQRLDPTPNQPEDGDTPVGSIEELEEIIRETHFMVPLVVVQAGSRYVILDGHRRLRVARALGLKDLPCIVLTVEPNETVEILFLKVQRQMDAERQWPWSEIDE